MTPVESQAPTALWSGALATYTDFEAADALYNRVFHYGPGGFGLNANLLSALVRNGGSAVGVKTPDGTLVGFAYGFAATDGTTMFHYSQAAVVDDAYQGHHIGRTLKLRQREVALAWGATRMRWTFDPAFARNAHFNFDTLGASGIAFVPDYYDRAFTDRIVVEWNLERGTPDRDTARILPPERFGADDWLRPVETDDGIWLPVPSGIVPGQPSSESGTALRGELRSRLASLFADGRIAVSCIRTEAETSAYRFAQSGDGMQGR